MSRPFILDVETESCQGWLRTSRQKNGHGGRYEVGEKNDVQLGSLRCNAKVTRELDGGVKPFTEGAIDPYSQSSSNFTSIHHSSTLHE